MRPTVLSRRSLLAAALLAPAAARAQARTVRLGILPFGTVSWEAETIRREGLDRANGFTLETVRLATNEAARIAFQGAQVDLIVSDLLWAARLRNDGRGVRFIPYSATEGAVMVPPGSRIGSVGDLAGKRIGVAGGALDKNWLLLRAHAREAAGLDLAAQAAPAYGAPPLLAQKLEAGELDAALLYWQFCARLEAKGYRRLLGGGEIARSFGLEEEIALIGYVFDEEARRLDPALVAAFARASAEAKRRLASGEGSWEAVRPLMEAPDPATFETLRRYFLEGIPRRPVEAERADAERLYAVLARLGGEKLVGSGAALPPGLYWTGEPAR
jgi:NitT/TauT family transport system substrate-binding protein